MEQLLRPPVEKLAALTYMAAAAICLLYPSALMLGHSFAVFMAVVFIYLGIGRAGEALSLRKYQYQLFQLPGYWIHAKDIPKSLQTLFVGLGFQWAPYHTQRRADLERPEWRPVTEQFRAKSYRLARAIEKIVKPVPGLSWFGDITRIPHYLNPVAPIPRRSLKGKIDDSQDTAKTNIEGDPTLHGVGLPEAEDEIGLAQSERVAHTFVVGTTRVGKTRFAEALVTQDIHNANTVIVFDPKGDSELLERIYREAERSNRLHHFYVFHLGHPKHSARYNPIGDFGRITEVAGRISSQLPGEGNSAAFREFSWRYVNVIAKALNTLGSQISYEALIEHGSDIDPLLIDYLKFVFQSKKLPNWEKKLEAIISDPNLKMDRNSQGRSRIAWAAVRLFKQSKISDDIVAFSLIKTFEYDKSFYDKLVASLFPLLEKLTSGDAGSLLSPDYFDLDDVRPIFNWMDIIRQEGIVYVGLDALSDPEVASAVGASMFADLTSVAGKIYKQGVHGNLPGPAPETRSKVCIHADEFNELVGPEFVPMVNKAGGAGFQITAYTQTFSDIEVRFGNKAKAGQVIGNLGTLFMLRVKELATAELLTAQLREVEVKHLELQSLFTDSSNPESSVDFTSRTGQTIQRARVPMVHPNDLLNLPKGHAFAMLGGTLHKIRMPQFKQEKPLKGGIGELTSAMKKTYRVANDDWSRMPDRWVA